MPGIISFAAEAAFAGIIIYVLNVFFFEVDGSVDEKFGIKCYQNIFVHVFYDGAHFTFFCSFQINFN